MIALPQWMLSLCLTAMFCFALGNNQAMGRGLYGAEEYKCTPVIYHMGPAQRESYTQLLQEYFAAGGDSDAMRENVQQYRVSYHAQGKDILWFVKILSDSEPDLWVQLVPRVFQLEMAMDPQERGRLKMEHGQSYLQKLRAAHKRFVENKLGITPQPQAEADVKIDLTLVPNIPPPEFLRDILLRLN